MTYFMKLITPQPATFAFFLLSVVSLLIGVYIYPESKLLLILFTSSGLVFVINYCFIERTATHIRALIIGVLVFIVKNAIDSGFFEK